MGNLVQERRIDWLLSKYAESHQHATNKFIHWVCVPTIMFSLFCMLYSLPFPVTKTLWANWAAVAVVAAWIYYATLSIPMFVGFIAIGGGLLFGSHALAQAVGDSLPFVALGIFAVAWVGQFIGHGIEGKKPSFIDDVQFLLIGPAWLLHFIYKKIGIQY